MKDWQRCMDGFTSTIKFKQRLPAISSYSRSQEHSSQKTDVISWSSSEDETTFPETSKKKVVVMKLNFEEGVMGSSGQIKPRVSRSVNTSGTQQNTLSTSQIENLNEIGNDSLLLLNTETNHSPHTSSCKSPIFKKRNKRKRIAALPESSLNDSNVTLPDSPIFEILSPKSPIICSARRRKKSNKVTAKEKDSEANNIILTPRPSSPVLRKKKNIRRKLSSPVLGRRKSDKQIKKERSLLEPAAVPTSPDVAPLAFAMPKLQSVVHRHTLQHDSQEYHIEECSQESYRNTTIQCIDVPSSQDVDCFVQSQESQVTINVTQSSVEEKPTIDVVSSQSTDRATSPTFNLDSASKSKARMARHGLAEQLNKLLCRRRSNQRMWRHEKQSSSTPPAGVKVKVLSATLHCARWLVLSQVHETGKKMLMILETDLVSRETHLRPGNVITVFPKCLSFQPAGSLIPVFLSVNHVEVNCKSSGPEVEPEIKINTTDFSCTCSNDGETAVDQCPDRLTGEGRELLKTLFLREEHVAWQALHEIKVAEEMVQTLDRTCAKSSVKERHNLDTQTLNVADALTLHSCDPGASVQLVLSVLRVCTHKSRGIAEGSLPSQSDWDLVCLVIGKDSAGELCFVKLPSGSLDIKEGVEYHFRELSFHQTIETDSTPDVLSMLSSLSSSCDTQSQQHFLSVFSAHCLVTEMVAGSEEVWLPRYIALLADSGKVSGGRLNVVARVLLLTKTSLYVTDLSLIGASVTYMVVHVGACALMPAVVPGCIVCIRDVECWAGSLKMDRFSSVYNLTNPMAGDDTDMAPQEKWLYTLSSSAEGLREMKPQLPPLSPSTEVDQLVMLQGIVSGVDEESAYSWPVCFSCNSDLLQAGPDEALLCALCGSPGPFPNHVELTIMMQPDAVLHNLPSSSQVKVKLQQKSVEKLLPGCQYDNEGYQLDSVLGHCFGPLACRVMMKYEEKEDNYFVEMEELLLA